MLYEKVLKFVKIIGSIFIILSILEIVFIILFNFTPFNFNGTPISLHEFIYSGSIISLSGTILWIFVNISMVCFLLVGIFIFKIANKKKIESRPMAKLMVVSGMAFLIAAFIELNYIVLLGKSNLTPVSGTIDFQRAIYDLDITPLWSAVFWVFFISVSCCFLIGSLFITAVGIKWTLLQEEEDEQREK